MKNYFRRNRFFILSAFWILLFHSSLYAIDGAGMAFKVSLSGKIYHKFSFLFEEDIRPKSNFKQAEWFLTTGEVNYTFNPYVKAGVAYMLLCQYKASEELRNRYYVYASASYPIGNLSFSLRERFQSTFKTGGQHPKNYLRTMLTVHTKSVKQASPLSFTENCSITPATKGICTQSVSASLPEAIIRSISKIRYSYIIVTIYLMYMILSTTNMQ